MLLLLRKRTADVMDNCLSIVFLQHVRLGSISTCWRQANVTPIPKSSPSSSVANYPPISITSVLSMVFEHLVSVRLEQFMERSGVLPKAQFAHRKGLGVSDTLMCMPNTLKVHWRLGRRLGSCKTDFSAAFDIIMVNQQVSACSALRVSEILCSLYWRSFYQNDHSKFGGWLLE